MGRGADSNPLPSNLEIKAALFKELAMDDVDPALMSLSEVVAYSVRRAPENTQRILEGALTATASDEGGQLVRLLQAPWARVYDFTGSTVLRPPAVAIERMHPVPEYVDATGEYVVSDDKLQVIHMCGVVGKSELAFGAPSTSGVRDRWYSQFQADIVTRPVVVVCDPEPPAELWTYLSVRREVQAEAVGHLPAAYLSGVTELEGYQKIRADAANLSILESDLPEFVRNRLAPQRNDVNAGARMLARLRAQERADVGVQLVGRLLNRADSASSDYLRGYDPGWADVASQSWTRTTRLTSLWKASALDEAQRNITLVIGRAGSGKTGALMRFAYEMHGKSKIVAWIDREATDSGQKLVDEVLDLAPDAVVIDDVDIFGDSAGDMVRLMNRSGRTAVVASVRTTRASLVPDEGYARIDMDAPLTDEDLRGLISSLRDAGLLGVLKDLTNDEQLTKLRLLSERDLLPALVQVVTGRSFEDRIRSEYEQLAPVQQETYGLVAFYNAYVYETTHLPDDHLLQMLGGSAATADAYRALQRLVESKLLVRHGPNHIKSRHRAVASVVAKRLDKRDLASIETRMLSFYAGRAAPISDPAHPDRRRMVRLLSHSLMIDLGLNKSRVREAYSAVQSVLENDFHYWLQRGAFEVERGDLDLASSYLEAARRCDGGGSHFKVTTEWGAMCLQRAINHPMEVEAQDRAVLAFDQLEEVARTKGASSPHTFAILARDGVRWLDLASALKDSERMDRLQRLDALIALGRSVCAGNRPFLREADRVRTKLGSLLKGGTRGRYPLA